MSGDLQAFLAKKWQSQGPGENPPLYDLLSDAALALVSLPSEKERLGFVAHFARELVAFGVQAGLSLGDLRALSVRLQNELTDAISRELEP